MGSIRWWSEALARGVGAEVPAPGGKLDPVAGIFGTTDRKRLFSMTVTKEGQTAPIVPRQYSLPNRAAKLADINLRRAAMGKPPLKDVQDSTWYYPSGARDGDLAVRMTKLRPEFDPKLVGGVLRFISRWGALGAKAQLGMGVIGFPIDGEPSYGELVGWLNMIAMPGKEAKLPAVDSMFFAKLPPPATSGFSPEDRRNTFWLKYQVRELWRSNQTLRHEMMGSVSGNTRLGARISLSWPYRLLSGHIEMRVWGWAPGGLANRDALVLQPIFKCLSAASPTPLGWHEYGATARDPNSAGLNRVEFVEQLLST